MQVFVILETVWAQECRFSTPTCSRSICFSRGLWLLGIVCLFNHGWFRGRAGLLSGPQRFLTDSRASETFKNGACAKGALLRLYSRGVRLERQNSCFFTCFHSPIDASSIGHASELLLSLPQSIFSSFFKTTQGIHEPGRIFSSRCALPAPPTWLCCSCLRVGCCDVAVGSGSSARLCISFLWEPCDALTVARKKLPWTS